VYKRVHHANALAQLFQSESSFLSVCAKNNAEGI